MFASGSSPVTKTTVFDHVRFPVADLFFAKQDVTITRIARPDRALRISANDTEVAGQDAWGGRPTLRRSLNSLAEIGAVALNYRRVSMLDRGLLQR